jgi:capsule biosynthesis phosphatase
MTLPDPSRTAVFDVDDTILQTENRDYQNSVPIHEVIEGIRALHANGWTIILHTARGMGRSNGNIDSVADEVVAEIKSFCSRHAVPYDRIQIGKPWAALYVDDKAMTPSQFVASYRILIP